jgi:hypothetical protein
MATEYTWRDADICDCFAAVPRANKLPTCPAGTGNNSSPAPHRGRLSFGFGARIRPELAHATGSQSMYLACDPDERALHGCKEEINMLGLANERRAHL